MERTYQALHDLKDSPRRNRNRAIAMITLVILANVITTFLP